ncbi:Putative six-bladed beta-propeller, TolB, SMP-30/Gluconolactonase/LRE-like region [Colletotrichum destructivum]|uniref:Six-bladed beta-propeller, TolB, SMP-30/Gluconolactonase/LRE-like region n=1 Tax=Colletotrichum destructivum TaxID=34406 RepID=A0AAX4J2X6_9PEZI|nr:Putative six-bladed beta-propeller, TolB, SMP-30/Gluconolactonase/LRE-like region [Colletotrichum destructivum]
MANASAFVVYNDRVKTLFGPAPTLELLHENQDYPFAHEAGVFIERNNTLFVTSNQFSDHTAGGRKIQICRVTLPPPNGAAKAQCEEIHPAIITMANGGVNYLDGIVFCAQGTMDSPGGLVFMEAEPPYQTRMMVNSFHGREFNSLNDVVGHSDGSLWFTDPIYGYEQGIRPRPKLPNQVYRYDPIHGSIRAMADGFGRPNGICFSPDEKVVYITDTDWIHGDGSTDLTRASTIYAFDVVSYSGEPFLTNRRLFAMASEGIPDGIKCDVHGNVYSGCGDGLNIWSPGGVLLGKILVQGGAANFCFGRNGEVFILNENRLWRAKLADETKGALLCI